jgi:hypothetical protein
VLYYGAQLDEDYAVWLLDLSDAPTYEQDNNIDCGCYDAHKRIYKHSQYPWLALEVCNMYTMRKRSGCTLHFHVAFAQIDMLAGALGAQCSILPGIDFQLLLYEPPFEIILLDMTAVSKLMLYYRTRSIAT